MRTLSMPFAAALLAAAAAPVAAQHVAAPVSARHVVQHHAHGGPIAHAAIVADAAPLAGATDAVVRPLAVFRLTPKHDYRLPLRITIADSAGAIVARFRMPGEGAEQPMMVTTQGDELVLQADTRVGPLTVRLHSLNEMGPQRSVVGRWSLGPQVGELWGRAAR